MKTNETIALFIEFQNDFCRPQGAFHSLVAAELERLGTIANAKRLLDAARNRHVRVVHCPFVYDGDWVVRNRCTGLQQLIHDQKAFQPNTWGAAIIDEMAPWENETVLTGKHALSAFENTELTHVLKTGGYKNLLICGFLTNVCVQATAFSAYDRGFHTRLLVDACASGGREIQEYVEQQVCPIFGGQLTVDKAVALWC